jgi:UPF0755 protein
LPLILLSLASLPLIALATAYSWWNSATSAPVAKSANEEKEYILFSVDRGMGGSAIGEKLEKEGLIESAFAWKLWSHFLKQRNSDGGFKSGTYQLSKNDTLTETAAKIWRGEVVQTKFTIPEGWSIAQMAKYFESLGYFKAEDFIKATQQIPRDKYSWLPSDISSLEGFLFPDTYQISSDGITVERIIATMLDRFTEVALPVYQQADNPEKYTLLQWATLASVVEKESVVQAERPLIAGVFVQRLKIGMRLQSDPTVEYGLGIKQTADRPLTFKEVETYSPYNTYVIDGLPPAPIAAPGLASLKATLNPESSEYLYFVARYDGTHVFSKTLSEHEAATRTIRQQRNNSNN